ncbi:MAG: DUF4388 domain-containing protein [Acidimicrobiales bacterium]
MSLQGSIETFAIADVLRLLAATSKSGRLHVQGTVRAGTVWVESARILAADSPSTPIVTGPVDILFQLLRFERGSFRFELDKYPPEPGEPLDIELALSEAEAMVVEWRELERRIPAQDCWVELKPALTGESVSLTADEWLTLVAVAGGRTVADIGQALVLGELQTARALARLLDLKLIDIVNRPPAAHRTDTTENGSGSLSEPPSFGQLSVGAGAEASFGIPSEAPSYGGPSFAAADGGAMAVTEDQPASAPHANGSALAGQWPDSNGLSGLAPPPPVPPTPLTPPPSWAPAPPAAGSWAAPSYPTLAPAPEAAPNPATEGPFPGATRPEAGLTPQTQPRGDFSTPPETDLDHGAAAGDSAAAISGTTTNPYGYPAAEEGQGPDPYSYPPPASSPEGTSASPSSSPPTVAGAWSPAAQDPAVAGGYPALAPPMPPAFGSSIPGGTSGRTPGGAEPTAGDNGWIGSLTDAIERADDAGEGQAQPAAADADRSHTGNGWTVGTSSGSTLSSRSAGVPPMPPAPRVTLGGATWGGTPIPPPPAPPAPAGGWASASQFDGGTPERLAPPPPPPPFGGLQTITAPATVGVADPPRARADQFGGTEDADDIDRQLFNLSPRAREAVKQSSGLYDARDHRG